MRLLDYAFNEVSCVEITWPSWSQFHEVDVAPGAAVPDRTAGL